MTDLVDLLAPAAPANPVAVPPKHAPQRHKPAKSRSLATASRRRPIPLLGDIATALEQRRLLVLLPFALMAGLFVGAGLDEEPQLWALSLAAAALCLTLFLVAKHLALVRLLTVAGAALAGLALLPIHGALFGTPMLGHPVYGLYRLTIDEVLSTETGEARVLVSAITPLDGATDPGVRRARLLIKGLDVAPGDTITGKIRFYPVPGPAIPNGFDSQFQAYFDGVGAYASTTSPPTLLAHGDNPVLRGIEAVRRTISARIDAVLKGPSAGIARALINGDQNAITDEVRQDLATAGLAHVYSVSGLHLTLVAGLALIGLRRFFALLPGTGRRISAKSLAALGAMALVTGYFAISGGNVAALRSTLMILLVLGAVVFGRQALTMRNVAFAALFIVVTDPASSFRPSFQLSFSAVVALVGIWELVRPQGERDFPLWERFVAGLIGSILTSAVAGFATLLFSVYYFQQTSPLGVVSNLLALPLVSFVMMPMALIGTLLMPFGLEAPFMVVLGFAIDLMLGLAHWITSLSAGLTWSPLLTPLALLIGLGAFAWFAFLASWWRLLVPALAIPLIALFALDRPPDVLIADTTQAIAARGETGLELVTGKATSFAVTVWADSLGQAIAPRGPLWTCDKSGCTGTSPAGFSLAAPKSAAAFDRACGTADLIVYRARAPRDCPPSLLVDARSLKQSGALWLTWNATTRSFLVRKATTSPHRPWRVRLD